MVSSESAEGLIYNVKLSSVGPGSVTGQDVVYEPSNLDLAMKLHYLRGVYYFESPAFEGLSVIDIKEPLFTLFNVYYMTCGRFRRADSSGRPYIKCNDCGVRFVEAYCDKSLEEWVEMRDAALEKLLTPNQVIGPELFFSPALLIQYNKFKCGGVALGLTWAHVLGDVFSATEFMNMFGKVVAGTKPARPMNLAQTLTKATAHQELPKVLEDPLSIKKVGPVGDHWTVTNNCTMERFSFFVGPSQLGQMRSTIGDYGPFELLSAIIWQGVARHRNGPEPKVVTVCRKSPQAHIKAGNVGNSQAVSTVKLGGDSIGESNLAELARLLKHEGADERRKIDEAMEKERGDADVVFYGANLTFVDMEDADFYGFEWRGQKPVKVSYQIDGVGDDGCVLVLPAPRHVGEDGAAEGRLVTVILPENEVKELKSDLKKEWSIA
nr:protein ECERIFERUM 26-like [Ipomoea trifida]